MAQPARDADRDGPRDRIAGSIEDRARPLPAPLNRCRPGQALPGSCVPLLDRAGGTWYPQAALGTRPLSEADDVLAWFAA
jgi:hypothetical protein